MGWHRLIVSCQSPIMENNLTPLETSVDQFDEFLLKPRGDKFIRINISRNTLIAIIFSLLVHGLLLIIFLPKIDFNNPASPQRLAKTSLINQLPNLLI